MRRSLTLVATLFLALSPAGCDESADDGFTVDATGTVIGVVWLDRDGSTRLEASDGAVGDVRVELVPRMGGTAAYSGTSQGSGEFVIDDVLVGEYRARVDSTTVGDSLRVLRVDSANLTVEAGDTAFVLVGLTYPRLTIDSARAQPTDTRLFLEGLVLTRWANFGEASLHLRDSTGAIRAVRVQPTTVIPGDSVRLLGSTSVQTGQAIVRDGSVLLLRTGVESPSPDTVSTGAAAGALDGQMDANLVHVDSAVVQDTARNPAGELLLTVDDGTGSVDVVLDRDIQFFLQFGDGVIGAALDVTGVLVPSSPGGPWLVKPRATADIVVR